MSETVQLAGPLQETGARVAAALGEAITGTAFTHGELTFGARRDDIVTVLKHLREIEGFSTLIDIAGADYPARPERFEVVYHLLSMTKNLRLRVKIPAGEDTPVPSACAVWPAA
ncbi:MAG: NADH-quinone oxidoreductase subunit C, partial [Hyphomonadaceae bacterium]|nr:NADH-quinone oxidoreductase subunit C [Hyphomonadaceae bacterium]